MVRTDSLLTLGVNNPADPSTNYYNDWASGRFPYMLTANVTLSDNNGGTTTKQIRFINVHAKANTSPVLTAYARRADGAHALDSLLKAQFPTDNVVILGDFNDDLNQTITAGVNPPVTSWSAFTITDSALYKFPTQPLSPAGQHSDVDFTSVIDNVIVNDSMAKYYLPASATVLSNVSTLVTKLWYDDDRSLSRFHTILLHSAGDGAGGSATGCLLPPGMEIPQGLAGRRHRRMTASFLKWKRVWMEDCSCRSGW